MAAYFEFDALDHHERKAAGPPMTAGLPSCSDDLCGMPTLCRGFTTCVYVP